MQGKTINGFELQRPLGVGGMAEVWLAENGLGKKAAVKLLLPKLCKDENVVSRFRTEAKVMVDLNHPNIRQVYDYGELDGRPAIIMEYLDGDDLKARMKRGQCFTNEELKRWWNQLVSALNYTHQKGIVHRDIKPGNIFVDNDGNVKLLDFGIAKVRESISRTLTGQKLGTLMYMSPEQVLDSKHVDYRTDIYSLAVTFVHLITGKRPYDSDTSSDFEISEQIVRKPMDLSGLPIEWRNLLEPYLDKNAIKRPALCAIKKVDTVTGGNSVPFDKPSPTKPKDNTKGPLESDLKERHGFVTFWFVFMIASNLYTLFINIRTGLNSMYVMTAFQSYVFAAISILNIIGVSFLFKWKKKGFWMLVINASIVILVNLIASGLSLYAFVPVISIAILCAILQIKKNGLSCWQQLN